jgi:hypothetical protein
MDEIPSTIPVERARGVLGPLVRAAAMGHAAPIITLRGSAPARLIAAEDADGDGDMAIPLADNKALWTARVNSRSHVRPGQDVQLAVDTRRLHFFDPSSGLAIGHPDAVTRHGAAGLRK